MRMKKGFDFGFSKIAGWVTSGITKALNKFKDKVRPPHPTLVPTPPVHFNLGGVFLYLIRFHGLVFMSVQKNVLSRRQT